MNALQVGGHWDYLFIYFFFFLLLPIDVNIWMLHIQGSRGHCAQVIKEVVKSVSAAHPESRLFCMDV